MLDTSKNTENTSDNTIAIQENLASFSNIAEENKELIDEMTCIFDYRIKSGEYCGEWAGATLKRLPLWGDNIVDEGDNIVGEYEIDDNYGYDKNDWHYVII